MAASKDDLVFTAKTIATRHSLDPALVCAIVERESDWQPLAIRYEPAFRSRYVGPLSLAPTEEVSRSISWGLMQVMGQVAREHGFTGEFLSALCDPMIGIAIGCTVLATKVSHANGDVPHALLLWNGGANPEYPAEVLTRLPQYR